jgi:ABC-type phosphate/phosphonate transport system ATPase subunit
MVEPVSYFVNHKNHLQNLNTNLEKYHQASVVGISGMGKTQLIRMYSKDYSAKYDLIWFFDCNLDLNHEFLKLATEINKHLEQNPLPLEMSGVKKEVMHYLTTKKNWLLVFDNKRVAFIQKNGHWFLAA